MTTKHCRYGLLAVLAAGCALTSIAQEPNPTATPAGGQTQEPQSPSEIREGVPVFKVQVVGRDIPAINYFHRSHATKIGFAGTSLLPGAKGSAKVTAEGGRAVIELEMQGLTPANGFGPEYLTYVLWAITPEGRPMNLGEVLPTGSKDKNTMTVTANLQTFGLIITAEPYFAVTMPSDVVVAQNFVINDKTEGVIEQVNAHYSLLPRGAYTETAGRHTVLHPITRDERSPLELYEAMNAIQIAEATGADQYAASTMATAKTALQNAQGLDTHKSDRKQTITYAREAVQAAEDARIISIRKMKANEEAAQEQARKNAELEAQQAKAAADQQAAQRAQAEAAAADAEARAQRAREAEAAAKQATEAANQQTQQMRERLRQQLNQVLQTTESARGLIVNMSDVLFDFNKYTLKPDAREKLAKVSGILLAYPGLKLQVEGYTDNIGSDEYNQKLSEERADAVRDYLVSQSVQPANVSAAGYGKADPIADNSTASGRAQNRRVQMVVSGDAIGIHQESAPGAANNAQPDAQTPPAPRVADNPTGVSNPPQQ